MRDVYGEEGDRDARSEKDENLRKKSELIGSESRGQTILEAAVISRDAKETSQSDVTSRVTCSRNSKDRPSPTLFRHKTLLH